MAEAVFVNDAQVRIVNSAIYTLQCFQEQMKGEAAKAGFFSDDVAEWIMNSRREEAGEGR